MQLWIFVSNRFRSETMRKTTYSHRQQNNLTLTLGFAWSWFHFEMTCRNDVSNDICCQSVDGQSHDTWYCFSAKLLSFIGIKFESFRECSIRYRCGIVSRSTMHTLIQPAALRRSTIMNLHFLFGLARVTFNDWLHLTFYRRFVRTVLLI